MNRTSLVALCALILFRLPAFAEVETTAGFIAELNEKWVASDYTGIKSVINSRLQLKGNQDLVGLMAKCDYYAVFEFDLTTLQATAALAKQVKATLNWSSDKEALELLNAGIKDYENTQEAQAQGFIFGFSQQQLEELHTAYPNEYPSTQLLQRFGTIQYP